MKPHWIVVGTVVFAVGALTGALWQVVSIADSFLHEEIAVREERRETPTSIFSGGDTNESANRAVPMLLGDHIKQGSCIDCIVWTKPTCYITMIFDGRQWVERTAK